MIWIVPFDDPCIEELMDSLELGPIVELDGQEAHLLNEELVSCIGGLSVHVFADEHPPPHFHVKFNGEENSFSINDCTPLYPQNGLKSYFRNIRKWHRDNKKRIVRAWNDNRPDGCPVGKYVER